MGKGIFVSALVCALIITLPLAITSIVLGVVQPGNCDLNDEMGLDVGDYLLGLGIGGVVLACSMVFFYLLVLCEVAVGPSVVILGVLSIVSGLFGIAWFVVGGIILFRGNIHCIRHASSHVIYALVLWCLSAFSIVQNFCSVRGSDN